MTHAAAKKLTVRNSNQTKKPSRTTNEKVRLNTNSRSPYAKNEETTSYSKTGPSQSETQFSRIKRSKLKNSPRRSSSKET
jgi:hypothetical protein